MAPGPVVVGNDSRPSRAMMRSAVFDGLTGAGCRVIDLGIVPTPTIAMAVRHHQARGGIAITASHNPAAWNALKFFGPRGLFLNEDEGRALHAAVQSGKFSVVATDSTGRIENDEYAVSRHIEAILSMDLLDIRELKSRRFRVALDTVHGAGGVLLPKLLGDLGCEVIPLHIEPTGEFPRNPEPTSENLGDLAKEVAAANVDIGFAVDPDADRLVVLLENGDPAGEENTLVMVTDFVLRHRPGPVVANVSTTRALDDIAARHGQKVFRTKVGEAHVAAKMLEIGAEIGGEGNGGVMFAPIHCVRDSGVGITLILQALLESGKKTSQLFGSMPHYEFVKQRVEFPDMEKARQQLEQLPKRIGFGAPNRLDGLKWSFDDAWIQARMSNTEPIIRVFAEARTRQRAEELVAEIRRCLCESPTELR
jgi:phosphomannomutase